MNAIKEQQALYFLAIIPPAPVFEETMEFKREIRDGYHSKGALRSPSHITLHMPFRLTTDQFEPLCAALEEGAGHLAAFPIALNGFGSFPPRVIYVKVMPTPFLRQLHEVLGHVLRKGFLKMNATYRDEGFTPHLTIGFRDLKKAAFHAAWSEYRTRSYEAEWEVDSYWLLKHDSRQWEPFREFSLR